MQDMESKITEIFDRTNDWLKYIETKNTGIFVFSGAIIATFLSFLGSSFKLLPEWKIGLFCGIIFFILSCLLSIWSFIPVTKIRLKGTKNISDQDNLYFFGHICKYTAKSYITTILRLYYKTEVTTDHFTKNLLDLTTQLITNSQITMRKSIIFKYSAWSVFFGSIVTIIVPLILLLGGKL